MLILLCIGRVTRDMAALKPFMGAINSVFTQRSSYTSNVMTLLVALIWSSMQLTTGPRGEPVRSSSPLQSASLQSSCSRVWPKAVDGVAVIWVMPNERYNMHASGWRSNMETRMRSKPYLRPWVKSCCSICAPMLRPLHASWR